MTFKKIIKIFKLFGLNISKNKKELERIVI